MIQPTVSSGAEQPQEIKVLQEELQRCKDYIQLKLSSSIDPSLPIPSLDATANLHAMVEVFKERLNTSEEVASVLRNQLDEMLYNHEAASSQ